MQLSIPNYALLRGILAGEDGGREVSGKRVSG
jgi:hypothetical protein